MSHLQTLEEIGLRCGTDKSSRFHNYLEFYGELLAPFRHRPIRLLEIGVDGGESIKMWGEYLTHPESSVYGMDVHDKKGDLGRGKFLHSDGTDPIIVFNTGTNFGPFDVVVDDASHYAKDQKKQLELWWGYVAPGGLYIVEDCHTSFTFPWTLPEEESFVESTMAIIKKIHEHGKDHCARPTDCDIEEMIVRKSLTVLRKAK